MKRISFQKRMIKDMSLNTWLVNGMFVDPDEIQKCIAAAFRYVMPTEDISSKMLVSGLYSICKGIHSEYFTYSRDVIDFDKIKSKGDLLETEIVTIKSFADRNPGRKILLYDVGATNESSIKTAPHFPSDVIVVTIDREGADINVDLNITALPGDGHIYVFNFIIHHIINSGFMVSIAKLINHGKAVIILDHECKNLAQAKGLHFFHLQYSKINKSGIYDVEASRYVNIKEYVNILRDRTGATVVELDYSPFMDRKVFYIYKGK
jgi:hypothetical protein